MKRFGHVGDQATPEQLAASADKVPVFDQTHVDYLRKVFFSGAGCSAATTMDDAIRVVSFVAMDQAQREVIDHIQSLVNNRKGTI